MLRNILYVYGEQNKINVPIDLNYGKHLLNKFWTYRDCIAMIDSSTGETVTYAKLAQLTVDIAISLARIGVGKGDVVAISSEDRIEVLPTIIGAMCAAATWTILGSSGAATILHKASLSKPKVVFCSPRTYQRFKETLESVKSIETFIVYGEQQHPGVQRFQEFLKQVTNVDDFMAADVDGWRDVVCIRYSSGTTGLSKGVPWTHLNIMFGKMDAHFYPGQRVLVAPDFYFFSLTCLHAGTTLVFIPRDDAAIVLEAVGKYKVQLASVLPAILVEMAHDVDIHNYDVSSLEHILSVGAPLRTDLVYALKERYPRLRTVYEVYGCTEIGGICSTLKVAYKPGSVGPPLPDVIAKVVDLNTREPVGAYQRGEMCFKTPSLFPGYIGVDPPTHLDPEGFYKTGDVGYYDEDGYFFIVGRSKDSISYRNRTVHPADLEAVLALHAGVREACVVGAPHKRHGELPTAFVVLRDGARVSEQELADFVNEQVVEYRGLAGGVRFVASLPRGARGKFDRKALREILKQDQDYEE